MEEKIIKVLMDKPLIIPRIIFNNYRKLGMTESELILIIYIMNSKDKIKYDPEVFASDLFISKYKVMELINGLLEKQILQLVMEENESKKMEEYLKIDNLYNKISNLVINKDNSRSDETNIYSIFEKELGRKLTPMEYDIIGGWLNNKISKELIIEALRETVYNGICSFNYIEQTIHKWQEKGIKNKDDLNKVNQTKTSKKTEKKVFDYNWLDDE